MGYTIWPDGNVGETLQDVYRERLRQDELQLKGKFPFTCAMHGLSMPEKLAVLAEEFGEASRHVAEAINLRHLTQEELTKTQRDELRAELIQVAAVAVAWAETL